MKILGIDPGSAAMGFGVIEDSPQGLVHITHGATKLTEKNLAGRLVLIKQQLVTLIREHKPDAAGVEKLFFAKNKKTALEVAQARGVILLTLHEAGLPLVEPTPAEVKQAVTNYGAADKTMVHKMVLRLLNKETLKGDDNAIDALAIAITTANTLRLERHEQFS